LAFDAGEANIAALVDVEADIADDGVGLGGEVHLIVASAASITGSAGVAADIALHASPVARGVHAVVTCLAAED
jgi:hypothetical protein